VLQLLPYPRASHPHGSVCFDGEELLGAESARMQALRGNRVAMVFQEPMTSLNPLHSIEKQLCETLILHRGLSRVEARDQAMELLGLVGLPDVEERLDAWPHQLSGGQRQRVMIAMALANEPDLLIADEPTTALDVTIQAQILALLKDLQARLGMAILLITHDLGIVRHMADRVYVMSDGEIVEHNTAESLFTERELGAVAAALAGGGQRVPARPRHELATTLRDEIRTGGDPLGEAFCRIRTPQERRNQGATYTPPAIVDHMLESWDSGRRIPVSYRDIEPRRGMKGHAGARPAMPDTLLRSIHGLVAA